LSVAVEKAVGSVEAAEQRGASEQISAPEKVGGPRGPGWEGGILPRSSRPF